MAREKKLIVLNSLKEKEILFNSFFKNIKLKLPKISRMH